jgi:choline dehydrogenase-like flavoprotein
MFVLVKLILDHSVTGAGYELVDGEISMDMLQDARPAQKAHKQYQKNQSGPLASTPLSVAFASYASFAIPAEVAALKECIMSARRPPQHQSAVLKILADRIADPEDPTFRLIFFPATINFERRCDGGDFFHPPPEQIGKMGTGIGLCLNQPLSVGTVQITSTSAEAALQIDPALLSHPADVELLSKGLELLAKMTVTEPLSKKLKERYAPPESMNLMDDGARQDWLRRTVAAEYHPVGTVATGQAVNERLKVLGTKGLRVVDASVIPLHISTNT